MLGSGQRPEVARFSVVAKPEAVWARVHLSFRKSLSLEFLEGTEKCRRVI